MSAEDQASQQGLPGGQAPLGLPAPASAPSSPQGISTGDADVKGFLSSAGYDPQRVKGSDSAKNTQAQAIAGALMDLRNQGSSGMGLNQKVLRFLDNTDPEFKQYVLDLEDKMKGQGQPPPQGQ